MYLPSVSRVSCVHQLPCTACLEHGYYAAPPLGGFVWVYAPTGFRLPTTWGRDSRGHRLHPEYGATQSFPLRALLTLIRLGRSSSGEAYSRNSLDSPTLLEVSRQHRALPVHRLSLTELLSLRTSGLSGSAVVKIKSPLHYNYHYTLFTRLCQVLFVMAHH